MGQFAGAAGTLASLHGRGLEVADALMEELGLGRPAIAWHTARDTIAETMAFLALVTGSLAKIATDVVLLTATETGEVFEPFAPGRGGSSTMPQKRNPVSSELILACAKQVQSRAALVMDSMAADLERSTGPWHVEWAALPEAFVLSSGALVPGALPRRGPAGRSRRHAGQYGPDARADRLRSRDDGPCARARPAGGARPRL